MMNNTVCRIYLLLFIVRNLKYVQVELLQVGHVEL